ncbi:MAG: putative LPS assembly protein LptD, partial [Bacteroidetes bacterium]|nr:putative LPS assembly protein LptD [Bacteroidota bacterium]
MYKDVNFGPKLKYTVFISRHEIFLRGLILLLFFILTFNFRAKAQDIPPISKNPVDSLSKIQPAEESISKLKLSRRDSISADSVRAPVPVGDISTTVKYTAKDSIRLNVLTKIVHLYGQSDIDYEPIGLQAEIIEIDWNTNTLSAEGKKDSIGKYFGTPVFSNGSEVYETRTMKYNFKTQKAIISGLVTEQGEGGGIIHGEEVFKNENNELFIPFVKYTTCNLSHPHFYIAARNVKAIPGNKMISGPFNMVINDVPTPLGFLFGMFPSQSERESGIIIPTYGEQQLKGYYLENGGYFFALSDYINLTATGSIYSKGGYGVNLRSQYVKRYHYSGNFQFNYTKQNLSDDSEAEPTIA